MGRLSTTECTYLLTYLERCSGGMSGTNSLVGDIGRISYACVRCL